MVKTCSRLAGFRAHTCVKRSWQTHLYHEWKLTTGAWLFVRVHSRCSALDCRDAWSRSTRCATAAVGSPHLLGVACWGAGTSHKVPCKAFSNAPVSDREGYFCLLYSGRWPSTELLMLCCTIEKNKHFVNCCYTDSRKSGDHCLISSTQVNSTEVPLRAMLLCLTNLEVICWGA